VTDRGTPPVGTPSRDPELKRSAVEQVFNPATSCEDTVEVGPCRSKPGEVMATLMWFGRRSGRRSARGGAVREPLANWR